MGQITVGALQVGSDPRGTAETLARLLGCEREIAAAGCRLVVMPEALLGGYPKGADFGARVGYRTPAGREQYLAYWKQAVDLDGPEVAALCKMASRLNTFVVAGLIERGGSTLYCTALFITAGGEIAGHHRKLMPTASERLIWGQGDGSTLTVVDSPAGRVGAAICWENYMPLFRTAMYRKGVELWCAPTVDEREIWQTSMRHIAYEGRMFLVSACQYQPSPQVLGRSFDDWPDDRPLIRGGSLVVSPLGEVLAGPLVGGEGLVCADIDLDDVVRARYDFDPVGHYARPDVFSLTVDEGSAG